MDTMELRTWTELADLEGFEVADVTTDPLKKSRRLTVTPTTVVGLCPHCHVATDDRHDCHDREVIDLPLGGWKTTVVVRCFQFHCGGCDKFFTPRQTGLALGAHATERFLERLAEYATGGDVKTAAKYLGVAEKTAEQWYYDYLKRLTKVSANDSAKDSGVKLKPILCLGIDELSLKKDTASSPAS